MSLSEMTSLPKGPHPFRMDRNGELLNFTISPNTQLKGHVVAHEGRSVALICEEDGGYEVSGLPSGESIGFFDSIHSAVSAAVSN